MSCSKVLHAHKVPDLLWTACLFGASGLELYHVDISVLLHYVHWLQKAGILRKLGSLSR